MDDRERRRLDRKIRNAAGARAVLTRVDDDHKMQSMQLTGLDGERWQDVERPEEYGFTSHPTRGEAFLIFPDGDRSHPVVAAFGSRDDRHKKNLAPGEVCVYHGNGDFLHFQEGNKTEQKTKEATLNAEDQAVTNTKRFDANASEHAEIKSPLIGLRGALFITDENGGATEAWFIGDVHIQGNLYVTGDIEVGGDVKVAGDVIAGGVSLRRHVHRDVTPGNGNTGKPVGG